VYTTSRTVATGVITFFMATLPQPHPERSSKKKISVRDRWRGKTNYKPRRFTGYAPISFAMVAEVGRLTTGKATQLLYVILTASLGQIVKPDESFNERACDLRTAELAELCGCDDRTIQRELTDLKRRSLILWEQTKKGVNQVTPLFRGWASLPDFRPGPVEEPKIEPEVSSDEEIAKDPNRTEVTRRPVHVAAGKRSKAIPVTCGVASIQFEASNFDAECSAVVQGGVLLVTLAGWVNGLLNQKEINAKPRHGCRIFTDGSEANQVNTGGQSSQKGRGRQSNGTSPVQHPRAAELCSLFDSFLLKSCGKSLSGDSVALLAACEAIQDVDHDFLVKVVVERASRPISSPRAAVAICKEVAHNWKKAKGLPPERKLPTREEIDAIVAQEREQRLKKQAEARKGHVAE
jgi:hypothetical protein